MMEIEIGGESVVIQQHEERQTEYVPTEAQSTAVEKVYWLYVFNQPDSSTVTSWCEAPLHEGNWQGPDNDGCFSMVSKSDKRNPCPMCSCSCMMGAVTEQITVQSLNRGEDQQVIDNACVDNVMKEDDNSLSQSFSTHDSQDEAATFEVVAEIPIHEQQCDDDDDDDDDGEMNSEIDGQTKDIGHLNELIQTGRSGSLVVTIPKKLNSKRKKSKRSTVIDEGQMNSEGIPIIILDSDGEDLTEKLVENSDNLAIWPSTTSKGKQTSTIKPVILKGETTSHKRGRQQLPCEYCGKIFNKKSQIEIHVRTHTNERPFKCDFCGIALKTRASLTSHRRSHTGEKPYSCRRCGKRFLRADYLKTHMIVHREEKEFKCPECMKEFRTLPAFDNHLATHTKNRRYQCTLCDATFKHASCHTIHMRTHTQNRRFICKVCTKSFYTLQHLNRHLDTHGGRETHKCPDCGRQYLLKHHLTKHRFLHNKTPGRSCVCETCGMCFSHKYRLRAHIRTFHSSETTVHKCERCPMVFENKQSLEDHVSSMHLGVNKFKCDQCPMQFRQKTGLDRHLMEKHGGVMDFLCDECGKSFPVRWQLTMHCKKYHVPNAPETKS